MADPLTHSMTHRPTPDWQTLAEWQCGLVSRRQLNAQGIDRQRVRRQVSGRRWQVIGPMVLATFTGRLTWEQRVWAAHLHAGPSSAVAGLSCARVRGLRGWERTTIEVLVPVTTTVAPLDGVRFIRTRRDLDVLRSGGIQRHMLELDPAVLLHAAEHRVPARAAGGLLAATVQQRLTSPERLLGWLDRLAPLSRSRLFRSVLGDLCHGSQSMAEVDLVTVCRRFRLVPPSRQRRRLDREGRWRFTDAEWDLPGGRTLVLEVDGAFHMEVEHWTADIRRQRKLSAPDRTVLRCTTLELRLEPESVVQDLVAHGVVHLSGRDPSR